MPAQTHIASAHARAGLAGNPSDALGGAALAVPVAAMSATVEVRSAQRLVICSEQPVGWASVDDLVEQLDRVGHDGGDRLVTAAIVTLREHLVGRGLDPDPAPFELRWRTDIPRSVGLAGSSALVIATMRALAARWGAELAAADLARLALSAEVDQLGIAAGWMDRAVQAHDAATLVDRRVGESSDVPHMRVVEPEAQVELLVAWDPAGASPSGRLHSTLRERHAAGDPEVLDLLDELVEVARDAAGHLARADLDALAAAVDRSCELRRGLGALDPATAELVRSARGAGAAATSAGSGGAVSVVPRAGSAREVAERLAEAGVACAPVLLSPRRSR